MAQRRDHLMQRLDRNRDGRITADELPPRAERLKTLDLDGDGVITRDELQRAPAPQLDRGPR